MVEKDLILCARLSLWIYGASKSESVDWVSHMNQMLHTHYGDQTFDLRSLEVGATRCAVVDFENQKVFVFCGTNEKKDWLTNLDIAKVPSIRDMGMIHRGFTHAYEAIREYLLCEYSSPNQIIFTGHSLGGALATVAAADAGLFGTVYTFGQPRVGDKQFALQYKLNTAHHTRVVHNNDIVTRVPSVWRFKHVGTELYADRNGVLISEITPWTRFKDRALGRLDSARNLVISGRLQATDGIKDHEMSNYLSIIQYNLDEGNKR